MQVQTWDRGTFKLQGQLKISERTGSACGCKHLFALPELLSLLIPTGHQNIDLSQTDFQLFLQQISKKDRFIQNEQN